MFMSQEETDKLICDSSQTFVSQKYDHRLCQQLPNFHMLTNTPQTYRYLFPTLSLWDTFSIDTHGVQSPLLQQVIKLTLLSTNVIPELSGWGELANTDLENNLNK